MKLVNWYYPEAGVVIRFANRSFEKTIRRAIGLIVGQHFIGWMKSDPQAKHYEPQEGVSDQADLR